MDTAQIYQSIDIVLSIYADVEPAVVGEVLGGEYNGSDQHYKFALWCVCEKNKFWAACILTGAENESDIMNFYTFLTTKINNK